MQLREIVQKLELKVASGENKLDSDVTCGYMSDILSDVMAKAFKGSVWITTQTHENVVAILFFKSLAAVILPNGLELDKIALDKAIEKQLPILLTDLSAFEIVGRLYELGISGQ
jgi:serine kinase of HPr protein (carbohydrate metabolism regulator)